MISNNITKKYDYSYTDDNQNTSNIQNQENSSANSACPPPLDFDVLS